MSLTLEKLPYDILREIYAYLSIMEFSHLTATFSSRLVASFSHPGMIDQIIIDFKLSPKMFATRHLLKIVKDVRSLVICLSSRIGKPPNMMLPLQITRRLSAMNPKLVSMNFLLSGDSVLETQRRTDGTPDLSLLFPSMTSLELSVDAGHDLNLLVPACLPRNLTRLHFRKANRSDAELDWTILPPALTDLFIETFPLLPCCSVDQMVVLEKHVPHLERLRGNAATFPQTTLLEHVHFSFPATITDLSISLNPLPASTKTYIWSLPKGLQKLCCLPPSFIGFSNQIINPKLLKSMLEALPASVKILDLHPYTEQAPQTLSAIPPFIKSLTVRTSYLKGQELAVVLKLLPSLESLTERRGSIRPTSSSLLFNQALDCSTPPKLKNLSLGTLSPNGDVAILPTTLETLECAFSTCEKLFTFHETHPLTKIVSTVPIPYPTSTTTVPQKKVILNNMELHLAWKRLHASSAQIFGHVAFQPPRDITDIVYESPLSSISRRTLPEGVHRAPASFELALTPPPPPPKSAFSRPGLKSLTLFIGPEILTSSDLAICRPNWRQLETLDLGTTPLELPFRLSLLPSSLTVFRSQFFVNKSNLRLVKRRKMKILDVPNFCISPDIFVRHFSDLQLEEFSFSIYDSDKTNSASIEQILALPSAKRIQINVVLSSTSGLSKSSARPFSCYEESYPTKWDENDPRLDPPPCLHIATLSNPDVRPLPRWQSPFPSLTYYITKSNPENEHEYDPNPNFKFSSFSAFPLLLHLDCLFNFNLPNGWLSNLPRQLRLLRLPLASCDSAEPLEITVDLPRSLTALELRLIEISTLESSISNLPSSLKRLISQNRWSQDEKRRIEAQCPLLEGDLLMANEKPLERDSDNKDKTKDRTLASEGDSKESTLETSK